MTGALKHILLIESEFYTRVQLDDDLSPYGFQVTSVKKVRNALIKLKTQIFQAIVISYDDDVETPLRLLATLRHIFNQSPVLVLAKRPTEAQLMQLMRYKPVEVMVKPYGLMDMVQRLESLIETAESAKNG